MAQGKRNIFSVNNKHQMQIIFLTAGPLFVLTAAFLIVTYFMSVQVSRLLLTESYLMVGPAIAQWFYITVCFSFFSLFVFLLLAFKAAYDLVNPFSRIISEIDEFLITGAKRTISVRPDDALAQEVSDRFNKLIAKIPG